MAELARRTHTSRQNVQRWADGERKLTTEWAKRFASALGTTAAHILLGGESSAVPVMGRIGAGAEIMPDFEQVPSDGLADISLPFEIHDDMIAFEVVGDSMLPAYEDGDVIVVRREGPPDAGALHGRVAAVRTHDGHRYLKRVILGQPQQIGYGQVATFHLESVNATTGTIYNVRLEWASPVAFTAKAAEVRKINKRNGHSSPPRLITESHG